MDIGVSFEAHHVQGHLELKLLWVQDQSGRKVGE